MVSGLECMVVGLRVYHFVWFWVRDEREEVETNDQGCEQGGATEGFEQPCV